VLSSLVLSSLLFLSLLNRLTQLHLNAKKAREAEKEIKAELEGGVEQLNKMLVRMYVRACVRARQSYGSWTRHCVSATVAMCLL
jgi:hypothetical protein